MRILASSLFALVFAVTLRAQISSAAATSGGASEKGATFYEGFYGSSSTLGQVYKLDSTVGYNFNRWFGIDGGLPVYLINPSSSTSAAGYQSGTGIGNAYLDLNFTFNNPLLDYDMTIEGTAPTGDKRLGLTTGRFTYDWNNHFERSFFSLTPFANLGLADTVSDTPLFTRPFTTFGDVAHFEGGLKAGILPFVSVGASVYDIVPYGTQKVFSRFNPRSGTAFVTGRPGNPHFFQNAQETVGPAGLARDNGVSLWADVGLGRFIQAQAGYTRSVPYALNIFSFGIGFDIGRFINAAR
jgi:hypothetical protein